MGVLAALLSLLALFSFTPAQRLLHPIHYAGAICQVAREERLDPWLLAAVVRHESGYAPRAVSPAGARGLMQLLPSTAAWMAGERGQKVGLADLFEPEVNLRLGAAYLRWLLDRYQGDEILALAAYNGGLRNVDAWRAALGPRLSPEQMPFPETRFFVASVLRTRARYRWLYPELARQASPASGRPDLPPGGRGR
jgi:soluble lytic murein transglycosylase